MPAANTTNAGAELKLAEDATVPSEPCKLKMAGVHNKAQPQGKLRCTYVTTNNTNKPNTLIDRQSRVVFNNSSQPPISFRLLYRENQTHQVMLVVEAK